jgi:hypothetical protein
MRNLITTAFALSALFVASGSPSQAASAAHSTCSGWMKSVCLSHRTGPPWSRQVSDAPPAFFSRPYQEKFCNFELEQCMKTGLWNGRQAERR